MTARRLSHVAEVSVSTVDKHTVEGEVPVRLCNYVDVYKNDAIVDGLNFMSATATPDEVKRFSIAQGDTLFTKDSETADDIGVPAFVRATSPLVCGYHVAIARPREDAVDPRFLYWSLASTAAAQQWQVLATGVTRVGLRQSDIGKLSLWVPDLREQGVIADFLDRETAKIDALIAKQERLVAALADRMTAEASSLVWRGLSDHELAPSGIDPAGDSPSHWRRLRNKDVLFERVQLSAAGDEELLTVSHLTGIRRRADSTVNMFEAESTEGYKQVEAGDLVINTLWAWMGALGVSELDGIVSPAYGVYTVRPGASVEPVYLHHLMRSPAYVTEMTRHSKGVWTSRLRLYPASFLGLNLVLPPLAEQHTIVAHLNERQVQTQVLIAKAKELISVMRERRAALITAAVTGKLDLTTYGKAG